MNSIILKIGCSLLVSMALIASCKSFSGKDVAAGADVVSAICTWIEEHYDSGVVLAVCATEQELAQFGKNPRMIMESRINAQKNVHK